MPMDSVLSVHSFALREAATDREFVSVGGGDIMEQQPSQEICVQAVHMRIQLL